MRWNACFVLLCLVALGCGEGSSSGPARLGSGGADGGGGGGGSALECDCALGEECADDGSCVSICGEVSACIAGGIARCCDATRVCQEGRCVADCGGGLECNGQCCEGSEMCFEGACVAQCEDPEQLLSLIHI